MEPRPRLHLTTTPVDKKLELVGAILLVVMWTLTVYSYLRLPATIPIHFNAAGRANGYGGKATLLLLPLIGTAIFFGITQLNKYPHIFNYMVKITEDNALEQYTFATRMLRWIKLIIVLVFSAIVLLTYLTATGKTNGIGGWFVPVTLVVVMLPTIIALVITGRKKKVG